MRSRRPKSFSAYQFSGSDLCLARAQLPSINDLYSQVRRKHSHLHVTRHRYQGIYDMDIKSYDIGPSNLFRSIELSHWVYPSRFRHVLVLRVIPMSMPMHIRHANFWLYCWCKCCQCLYQSVLCIRQSFSRAPLSWKYDDSSMCTYYDSWNVKR